MADEAKPKRKYARKAKVEPMAVYAVMVKITRGRKVETVYAESVRTGDGCLVVTSLDGPQPLVEKVRYIPLGSADIEVFRRPNYPYQTTREQYEDSVMQVVRAGGAIAAGDLVYKAGPQITPGPLELARQREAQGLVPKARPQANLVERNADGIAVVTAGFLDGSPT